MKSLYAALSLLVTAALLACAGDLSAQCPTCIPDETCISADGMPAVCPVIPPDATAGVYYEEQITFYLPTTVTDPGTGVEATLIDVTVTSVSGLPYGLTFTLNDADGVFHPSAGDNFGCATICGTPLLPGTYDMVIAVNALVSVIGFEVEQAQSFASVLQVLPGEGAANSFAYDNIAGCGSVDVNYEALISVPAPSVTAYSWDFGNGNTGDGALPPTVVYDAPGEYTASLTTTVSDYVLNGVSVSNLSNNWSGDIDDLISDADPYFSIFDQNGALVYTSAVVDNSNSASWTDPALTLSDAGFTIQFFDSDDISADDDLGTTTIPLSPGTNFFDIGNGTVGTLTVGLDVTTAITDSTTITVFDIPNPQIIQSGDVLSLEDPNVETVMWYVNGSAIDGAFDPSYTMPGGGLYYAVVTNAYGCSATSASILYCPAITIQYDALAQELAVEDVYATYQWYFNGLPLDGANSNYYSASDAGNYAVEITTDYGCETTSEVYTLVVSVDDPAESSLMAYPNPAEDLLFLTDPIGFSGNLIAVYDLLGKEVLNITPNISGNIASINVADLKPGIYFALINGKRIRWVKK